MVVSIVVEQPPVAFPVVPPLVEEFKPDSRYVRGVGIPHGPITRREEAVPSQAVSEGIALPQGLLWAEYALRNDSARPAGTTREAQFVVDIDLGNGVSAVVGVESALPALPASEVHKCVRQ